MEIRSVFDLEFAVYGKVIPNLGLDGLLSALAETEKPHPGTVYVPSCQTLEGTAAYTALQDGFYGGMPIQIGYCNGTNTKLNCLEYHRDSEVDITQGDAVLLVARLQDVVEGRLDTKRVEAFLAPAGTAVELYATTLHYAPCDARPGAGFRVAIVLPRGTNLEKPGRLPGIPEDALLWAKNKWLIAHPDTDEARQGAFPGLLGKNLDIAAFIS